MNVAMFCQFKLSILKLYLVIPNLLLDMPECIPSSTLCFLHRSAVSPAAIPNVSDLVASCNFLLPVAISFSLMCGFSMAFLGYILVHDIKLRFVFSLKGTVFYFISSAATKSSFDQSLIPFHACSAVGYVCLSVVTPAGEMLLGHPYSDWKNRSSLYINI